MKGVRIIINDGENYDNDMPPAFIPRFSVFYPRSGDLARGFSEKSDQADFIRVYRAETQGRGETRRGLMGWTLRHPRKEPALDLIGGQGARILRYANGFPPSRE